MDVIIYLHLKWGQFEGKVPQPTDLSRRAARWNHRPDHRPPSLAQASGHQSSPVLRDSAVRYRKQSKIIRLMRSALDSESQNIARMETLHCTICFSNFKCGVLKLFYCLYHCLLPSKISCEVGRILLGQIACIPRFWHRHVFRITKRRRNSFGKILGWANHLPEC